jgi:hypothetical protein
VVVEHDVSPGSAKFWDSFITKPSRDDCSCLGGSASVPIIGIIAPVTGVSVLIR